MYLVLDNGNIFFKKEYLCIISGYWIVVVLVFFDFKCGFWNEMFYVCVGDCVGI